MRLLSRDGSLCGAIIFLCLMWVAPLWAASDSINSSKKVYDFWVVPQFTPTDIHKSWSPILQELEEATGVKFRLKIAESIPKFEGAFLNGMPDFIYANPYHMVMAHEEQGYIPLVREGEQMLSGILVVDKEGPIKSIRDLDHQTIAFPAPNAFGASLYLRALLTRTFKLNFTPVYVKTHSNSYRSVVLDKAKAAGGILSTFQKEPQELQNKLSILYETPKTAPHPIAAHPRVSKQIRDWATKKMIFLSTTNPDAEEQSRAQTLLKGIQMPHPVVSDYQKDYQTLSKLKLEAFVVPSE